MALNPQQQKSLHEMLAKINNAIEKNNTTAALNKLLELDQKIPNNPMVLSLIGKAQGKMGRHAETIAAYEKAVKFKPKDGELRFFYAHALQKGGRYEESLTEYERALYHAPKSYNALRHKCSVLVDLDRIDDAHKAFKKLREFVSKNDINENQAIGVEIACARLSPKAIDPKEAIDGLNKYVNNEQCAINMRTAALWQVGRLYDVLGEYDNAFEAYKQCKELEKTDWDVELHTKRIDQLINCWTNDAKIPFSTLDGSNMIFIVGMMRSGTSLTEQMLAQIEGLTPGGEMNAITRQVIPIDPSSMHNSRPYALTRSKYTKATIQKMANSAHAMYAKVPHTKYLTDKQPFNYAHVPLIAHLFPGCKIIHCIRDPLDCCLSNFTQAFARPHMQTNDLYWIGRYYRDYERVMKAWHTLPEVDMIDLHYEELVSDPETQARRVLEFLEMEWTPEILDFHKSTRTVNTASRDQVRQPMYTTSVQKYKRYEHHLDELKRGLGIKE